MDIITSTLTDAIFLYYSALFLKVGADYDLAYFSVS